MALYRHGKIYWYDFQFQGERYQGSTHLKNRNKAQLIENKVRNDLALGLYGLTSPRKSPQFKAFAEKDFLNHVRDHKKDKPRTVQFYEEKVRRLVDFEPLANAALNQIDEKLLQDYVHYRSAMTAQKRTSTIKGSSINREIATLRKALRLAKDWRLVQWLPKFPRLPGEQGREFVIDYDGEKAYLEKAQYPLREVATLILEMGMRPNEVVNLNKEDVSLDPAQDSEMGFVRVVTGKTKNAARVLSMTARAKAVFESMYRLWPDSEWVFPGRRKGKSLTIWALDNLHAKLRVDAKLPKEFVIYSLRHTFGTRLGESGADAHTIKRIMGHSSVTVSEKYVHPTPRRLEQAFKDLERMNSILRGDKEGAESLGLPTDSTNEVKKSL